MAISEGINLFTALRNTVLNSFQISLTLMWIKSCDIKRSANALMWSLRPCIPARLYKKILRCDWRTLFAFMSYFTNTISWSARPIRGILLTLVTGVGLFVSRMSRVLSCRVGISVPEQSIYYNLSCPSRVSSVVVYNAFECLIWAPHYLIILGWIKFIYGLVIDMGLTFFSVPSPPPPMARRSRSQT